MFRHRVFVVHTTSSTTLQAIPLIRKMSTVHVLTEDYQYRVREGDEHSDESLEVKGKFALARGVMVCPLIIHTALTLLPSPVCAMFRRGS